MSLRGRIPYPGPSGPPSEVTSNTSPPRSEVSLSSLLSEYRINPVTAQSQGYLRAQSMLKSGARRRRTSSNAPSDASSPPRLPTEELVPVDLPVPAVADIVPPTVIRSSEKSVADKSRGRNYLDEKKVASVLGIPEEEDGDAEDYSWTQTTQAEIHYLSAEQSFPLSPTLVRDADIETEKPIEPAYPEVESDPTADGYSSVDPPTAESAQLGTTDSPSPTFRENHNPSLIVDEDVPLRLSDSGSPQPTAKLISNGPSVDWRVLLQNMKETLKKMCTDVSDLEPRNFNRQTSLQAQSGDNRSKGLIAASASTSNLSNPDSTSGRLRKEDPKDSDKVPKSQLDAAQKRLREVEKVNMRIVVDMKKFKEQQSAQLKVLTKQLDSVMKTASLEDVSFPSPTPSLRETTEDPVAKSGSPAPKEKPAKSSALEMTLAELIRQLQKDRELLMETIKEMQTVVSEDSQKMSTVAEQIQEKLQHDKLMQKITVNNLEEVLKKLTGIERTQAMLAENAWRH